MFKKSEEQFKEWGFIISQRNYGDKTFLDIFDVKTLKKVDFIIKDFEIRNLVQKLQTGDAIKFNFKLSKFRDKIDKIITSVEIKEIKDRKTFPIQKKNISKELLRERSEIRPKAISFSKIFTLRSYIFNIFHTYFINDESKFIATPIITSNDAEGAGEAFKIKDSTNFFGKDANLTVSGQLHLEAFAQSLGSVYNFGPTFRRDKSNTRQHVSEFWMLEYETVWNNSFEEFLEEKVKLFLVKIMKEIFNPKSPFFAILKDVVSDEHFNRLYNCLYNDKIEPIIDVLTYRDAIDILNTKILNSKIQYGVDLTKENELLLVNYINSKNNNFMPIIITHYPNQIKPFYMKKNNKETICFDVIAPKVGEIIGGSQREDTYEILLDNFKNSFESQEFSNFDIKEQTIKKEVGNFKWYFNLRNYAYLPSYGFGLGFDRFLMYILDIENIRDVIPFPVSYSNLKF